MNQIIKFETVDFTTLVNTNKKLSVNFKSKMIDTLTENFTEPQHHWYISNLFMYINYHQTTDFPVNLEDVVKIAGFAHKKNAKRALENNFVLDQDYKVLKLPREQKQNAGRAEEEILLNLDTFKNLLMLVKTSQGKEIRKYYVQLENIYNKIVNEERIETEKLLEEQKQLLIQKESVHIKDKQQILLDSYDGKSVVYIILICGILYKFGNTDSIKRRFQEHLREIGPNIKLIYCIESKNNTLLENKLKENLKKTKHRKEQIINGKVQTELIEINDICIIKNTLEELNNKISEDKDLISIINENLKLENENLKLKYEKEIDVDAEYKLKILNEENIKMQAEEKFKLIIEEKTRLLDVSEDKVKVLESKNLELQTQIKKLISSLKITKRQKVVKPIVKENDEEFIEKNIEENIEEFVEIIIEDNIEDVIEEIDRKKQIQKAGDARYREKNAEKIKASRESEENRIKKRAADKIYRDNNKEKIANNRKEYAKTESGKETVKKYYENNKEEINRKRREYNKKLI
jgi:hypothetical protein